MRRLIALFFLVAVTLAIPLSNASAEEEIREGWYTMRDERGFVILQTGLKMGVGDRFIAEDNRMYEVVRITGTNADARLIEKVELAEKPGILSQVIQYLRGAFGVVEVQGAQKAVGIYHTHSDESFVPSDGASSIRGRGGIYDVGKSFADALRRNGFVPIHDTTSHDPHDARSYDRSRATVRQLLQRRPIALFDVHRDTAPPEVYVRNIGGRQVARVMIVVGRENPSLQANLGFAKRIKAVADGEQPGLVRGIFIGEGKFNQDMFPRALLLEVGSHLVPKEDAERGISVLASVLPGVIGATARPGPGPAGRGGESRSGFAAVGWLLLVVLLIGGAYLLWSTRGTKETAAKLTQLLRTEFGDLFGWRTRVGRRIRVKVREKENGDDESRRGPIM